MPESVTYVPGMECHLCARMGTQKPANRRAFAFMARWRDNVRGALPVGRTDVAAVVVRWGRFIEVNAPRAAPKG